MTKSAPAPAARPLGFVCASELGAGLLPVGALLAAVAVLSRVTRETVLSASVLTVALLEISSAAIGIVHVNPSEETIVELIELAP